jgi:hypothetical protein
MPSMMRAFSTKSIGADTNTGAAADGRLRQLSLESYFGRGGQDMLPFCSGHDMLPVDKDRKYYDLVRRAA